MFDFVKEIELEGALSRIKVLENSQNGIIDAYDKLSTMVLNLEKAIQKAETPQKLLMRVEELELWRSKIHDMLTTKNPVTEKEKLSPLARRWSKNYSMNSKV